MKRSFAVTIALVLISAVSLCIAVGIDMSKYKVEYTSADLFGDPSCADGLEISFLTETVRHAFWHNNIKLDENGFRAAAEFEFKPWLIYEYDDTLKNGFVAAQGINAGKLEMNPPEGILEEIAANGGELTKYYKYSDLYEYYNMIIDLNIDGMHTSSYITAYEGNERVILPDGELEFWKKFNNFFRIPALEGAVIEANYHIYGDNRISSWYHEGEGPAYFPVFYSAVSDYAMYFTMSLRVGDEIVDTGLIPGGYGIYMLPYDNTVELNNSAFVEGKADIDNLRMVYSLDTSADVAAMGISGDKSHLYYISYEDGKTMFRSIKLADMSCTQEICLCNQDNRAYFTQQDGFIVIILNSDYDLKVVAETSPNEYEVIVDFDGNGQNGDISKEFWTSNYRYNFSYACDGKRLAVVSHTNEGVNINYTYASTGVAVVIYEGSELKYSGEYNSTLRYLQVPKDIENAKYGYSMEKNMFYLTPRDDIQLRFI